MIKNDEICFLKIKFHIEKYCFFAFIERKKKEEANI
jgi:hypothetical protein